MSETLARDVFPAEVAYPDGSVLRDVRVFATSHRVVAYGVRENEIMVLLDKRLLDPGSIPASRSSLTGSGRLEARTAEGVFWVNRGRGVRMLRPNTCPESIGCPGVMDRGTIMKPLEAMTSTEYQARLGQLPVDRQLDAIRGHHRAMRRVFKGIIPRGEAARLARAARTGR